MPSVVYEISQFESVLHGEAEVIHLKKRIIKLAAITDNEFTFVDDNGYFDNHQYLTEIIT